MDDKLVMMVRRGDFEGVGKMLQDGEAVVFTTQTAMDMYKAAAVVASLQQTAEELTGGLKALMKDIRLYELFYCGGMLKKEIEGKDTKQIITKLGKEVLTQGNLYKAFFRIMEIGREFGEEGGDNPFSKLLESAEGVLPAFQHLNLIDGKAAKNMDFLKMLASGEAPKNFDKFLEMKKEEQKKLKSGESGQS